MPTRSKEVGKAERGAPNGPQSVFGNFAGDSREPSNAGVSPAGSPSVSLGETGGRRDAAPIRSRDGSTTSLQQRIDIAVARSFLHRLVAKGFEYPDEQSWIWLRDPAVHDLLQATVSSLRGDEPFARAADALTRELRSSTFEDFLTSHLCSFGHAARGPNPMNEIEYGELKADPLFQPHRLADLAAFYRAFGLEVSEDASERHDHICMELEFISVLAAKEAYALEHQLEDEALATLYSAQRQFLREHLGRWVPAFARRLARAAGGGVISALADFTRELVLAECARFGVNAGRDDVVLRPIDEAAESMCASCGINQLPPGALTTT